MVRVQHAKMVMGAVLALLAVGIVGGLMLLQLLLATSGDAALVHVRVDHEATSLFNGTVSLGNATALSALRAAGAEAGFDVEVEEYPGQGAYVVRVGPYREEGAEGWLYCVGVDDPCTHPKVAADRYALREGESVRWHWGTADDGLT